MNKNEKAEIIAEAKELIQDSTAIFLTDYSNINVADITELRN
ncbi:MAG: 50S ribosomal protein L10, partial [Ignavibacterium sp.]